MTARPTRRPVSNLPRILALALAMLAPACQDGVEEPSVVLVTIDTLRADHLGCYGYPRDTSPFLDSLAADGVRFAHAVAASSHTGPAHASILTSLMPVQHQVLHNGHRLQKHVLSLAEVFQEGGYHTAAFTSVTFLKSLDAGFDVFSTNTEPWKKSNGAATIDRALRWLDDQDPGRGLLLWVHLYDPHTPYLSDDSDYFTTLREREEGQRDTFARFMSDTLGYPDDVGTEDGMWKLMNSYDAEVRFADAQVRRLYEGFEARGLNDGTLWTILADHGEGLGNHYALGHDIHLYNEQVRIPWIIHRAGSPLTPRVVEPVVGQVDVLPTLADFAGLPLPDNSMRQGQSLWPLLNGEQEHLPDALAVSIRRPPKEKNLKAVDRSKMKVRWVDENVVAIQSRRFKYIFHSKSEDEFYDLVTDPLEQNNLAGQGRPQEAELRRILTERWTRWQSETDGLAPEMDEDGHIEELEALGY